MPSYGGTAFARDTQWNEFLMKYNYPNGGVLDDTAVFRNGVWFVDTTGNQMTNMCFTYGAAGYLPVVGNIG
jgi:hypothetical protein